MEIRATAWILLGCTLALSAASAGDLSVDVRDLQGNALADAVVFAEPVGDTAPQPGEISQAIIDQVNKQFVPRVSVMRAGTRVTFPNSDNIRHSVYSFSPAKTFTTKLYAGRQAPPIMFDRSGVVVLGCNIHDQMLAWAVIVDTPYFTKSGLNAPAEINALPPGEYRLNTWYPGLEHPLVEKVQIAPTGVTQKQVRIDTSRAALPKAST